MNYVYDGRSHLNAILVYFIECVHICKYYWIDIFVILIVNENCALKLSE